MEVLLLNTWKFVLNRLELLFLTDKVTIYVFPITSRGDASYQYCEKKNHNNIGGNEEEVDFYSLKQSIVLGLHQKGSLKLV